MSKTAYQYSQLSMVEYGLKSCSTHYRSLPPTQSRDWCKQESWLGHLLPTSHVIGVNKKVGYHKQIASQLRTQYSTEGIYGDSMTCKSRLRVIETGTAQKLGSGFQFTFHSNCGAGKRENKPRGRSMHLFARYRELLVENRKNFLYPTCIKCRGDPVVVLQIRLILIELE